MQPAKPRGGRGPSTAGNGASVEVSGEMKGGVLLGVADEANARYRPLVALSHLSYPENGAIPKCRIGKIHPREQRGACEHGGR